MNLRETIARQQKWIADHGGDVAGYVRRYGSCHEREHYGNGGEAIYEADTNHLNLLWCRAMNVEPETPITLRDLVERRAAMRAED